MPVYEIDTSWVSAYEPDVPETARGYLSPFIVEGKKQLGLFTQYGSNRYVILNFRGDILQEHVGFPLPALFGPGIVRGEPIGLPDGKFALSVQSGDPNGAETDVVTIDTATVISGKGGHLAAFRNSMDYDPIYDAYGWIGAPLLDEVSPFSSVYLFDPLTQDSVGRLHMDVVFLSDTRFYLTDEGMGARPEFTVTKGGIYWFTIRSLDNSKDHEEDEVETFDTPLAEQGQRRGEMLVSWDPSDDSITQHLFIPSGSEHFAPETSRPIPVCGSRDEVWVYLLDHLNNRPTGYVRFKHGAATERTYLDTAAKVKKTLPQFDFHPVGTINEIAYPRQLAWNQDKNLFAVNLGSVVLVFIGPGSIGVEHEVIRAWTCGPPADVRQVQRDDRASRKNATSFQRSLRRGNQNGYW